MRSTVTRPLLFTLVVAVVASACAAEKERADSPGSSSSSGAGGTGGLAFEPCASEGIVCDGSRSVTCSADGTPVSEEDCGASGKVCAPDLGCVACIPWAPVSCAGGKAVMCDGAGSGNVEFSCDPVQGMECNSDGCRGACTPSELKNGYLGCEYFPTVLANVVMSDWFDFAAVVLNTGLETAHVVVHRGATEVTSADVAPGALETLRLPWVPELKGTQIDEVVVGVNVGLEESVLVEDGAYRVRSTQPLSVVQFNALQYENETGMEEGCIDLAGIGKCMSFSNGASLLLPTTALGSEYAVASYHSITLGGAVHMGETVALTATRDGTVLEIVPHADIVGGPAFPALAKGATGTITLDAGDVFELTSGGVSDSETLAGTRIRSLGGEPFQVLAGVPCAQVPADLKACDHIEDIVLPLASLGTDHIVSVPETLHKDRLGTARIHAVHDDTELEFVPADFHEPVTLAAGETIELTGITGDFAVRGTKPFAVTQYMHGSGDPNSPSPNDAKDGDPGFAPVIPTSLFREQYKFLAPSDYDATYVNIVIPDGAEVVLDGTPLDPSTFTKLEGTSYSVAHQKLGKTPGHELVGSAPFGAVVYGYGLYTGYMVPAGLDVRPESPAVPR